jgi:hypothetical protein
MDPSSQKNHHKHQASANFQTPSIAKPHNTKFSKPPCGVLLFQRHTLPNIRRNGLLTPLALPLLTPTLPRFPRPQLRLRLLLQQLNRRSKRRSRHHRRRIIFDIDLIRLLGCGVEDGWWFFV